METKRHSRSFTLVETLVAITVLLVGVLGPLTLSARGITDGLFAKNQIAANYLAQEAIELVINEWLSNTWSGDDPWEGIGECEDCGLNIDSEPILGDCRPFYPCDLAYTIVQGAGRYRDAGTSGLPLSPTFRRTITASFLAGGNEMKVTVKVVWSNTGFGQREFTLVEHLYRTR